MCLRRAVRCCVHSSFRLLMIKLMTLYQIVWIIFVYRFHFGDKYFLVRSTWIYLWIYISRRNEIDWKQTFRNGRHLRCLWRNNVSKEDTIAQPSPTILVSNRWPGIDRKRRGPRLMILGTILCGRSSKIADTFCPDGYARPRMRATRLPSNLKAPRSSHLSLSLDDTVLFGRRLTVRFVSFAAPKSLVAYTARFHKLIRHSNANRVLKIGYFQYRNFLKRFINFN